MKLGRLQWTLIGLATVALVVFAPSDNEGDATNKARPAKQRSANPTSTLTSSSPRQDKQSVQTVGRVELERLARTEANQNEVSGLGDAFNTTSWYVPPPPAPIIIDNTPPPPPPAPTAPPLPFTYFGRYNETGTWVIILVKGDRIYTVSEGDVIDNTYRVEKFTAGKVSLTYLPLNIEQSLRTGESS